MSENTIDARSGKRSKKRKIKKRSDYYDYNLLAVVVLLICFGLVMLYSTSAYSAQLKYGNDLFYFMKQAAISGIFLIGAIIISQVDYHILKHFSVILFLSSVILLIAVKFLGTEANGATRWFRFKGLSFQPAELAKLTVILFLPDLIVKMGKSMKGWKAPVIAALPGVILSVLTLVFTKNLSSAFIIAGITMIIIFVAHPKTMPFVIMAGGAFGAVGAFVYYVANHMTDLADNFRLNRIVVWLDPTKYAKGTGMQTLQALYAIGSGGFFGKGLGNSTQKLGAVPEAQNDMIFSIICEELGVFGAGMLTLLFVYLLYRLMFIAQNAPDLYGSLMVTGIMAHIAIQVVLNIAVVTNTIPNTGITLPFVSYGGTSVVFLMAEIALALSVSKRIVFKD
ncbi:MAG TPA: FtsW/RodA/SpoVE family cell cycle protein [Candidatus Merdenecus merdavium]|nr:FtsW/RodA/SpoVE family cell cycle protein [Candidatus Merdenecus merdavium]